MILPNGPVAGGRCENKWWRGVRLALGEGPADFPRCSSGHLWRRPCDRAPPSAFPVPTKYERNDTITHELCDNISIVLSYNGSIQFLQLVDR